MRVTFFFVFFSFSLSCSSSAIRFLQSFKLLHCIFWVINTLSFQITVGKSHSLLVVLIVLNRVFEQIIRISRLAEMQLRLCP